MLKKGSDFEDFAMLAKYGPRADVPGPDGKTAAEIMARKKDGRFWKLAAKLSDTYLSQPVARRYHST